MFRLSGHIRRQVGKKVLELKGNAVIGFKQYFDLESEKRAITARAIGTAVKLARLSSDLPMDYASPSLPPLMASFTSRETGIPLSPGMTGMDPRYSKSPQTETLPVAKSLGESPSSSLKELFLPPAFKVAEPTIITLHFFPPGSIIATGGFVSATSIKLIDNDERAVREAWWTELREEIKSHAKALSCPFIIGYSESTSINEELAVLQCTGTAAWIDVAVMLGGLPFSRGSRIPSIDMILDKDLDATHQSVDSTSLPRAISDINDDGEQHRLTFARRCSHNSLTSDQPKFKRKKNKRYPDCQVCHITYSRHESPFPMAIHRCLMCKKNYVPEVLLTTIEPPSELKIIGEGRLIEAHVCRVKKIRVGDTRAMYVSESIPFCQYDIHRQLTHKLRMYGLNAIFGLKIQLTIGESLMTAVATGTAVYVRGLPAPPALKVFRNLDVLDDEDEELLSIQRTMMQQSENNRKKIEQALSDVKAAEEAMTIDKTADGPERSSHTGQGNESDSDSSVGTSSDTDEKVGRKNLRTSVVVQIDDEQDEDLVLLMDPIFPEGFSYYNTELPVSPDLAAQLTSTYNIQMITLVKQACLNEASHHPNRQLADIFRSLYQDILCQVGYFHPQCVLVGVKYAIHLPKDNVVQISFTGVATGQVTAKLSDTEFTVEPVEVLAPATGNRLGFLQSLGFPRGDTFNSFRQMTRGSLTDTFEGSLTSVYDDLEVFHIEEDETQSVPGTMTLDPEQHTAHGGSSESIVTGATVFTPKPSPHVEITPLSYIPQATIQSFLGRISLHFVKEATVVYETGTGKEGMGGFTHAFLTEMYAITRAHAVALGGNAVLAFSMDQVTVVESIRNQAYALVSLSADVLLVEYENVGSANCQTTFSQRLFGKV